MKEYKVLTVKGELGAKESIAQRMEDTLNQFAKENWRVINCAVTDVHAIASRYEFVAILERDIG